MEKDFGLGQRWLLYSATLTFPPWHVSLLTRSRPLSPQGKKIVLTQVSHYAFGKALVFILAQIQSVLMRLWTLHGHQLSGKVQGNQRWWLERQRENERERESPIPEKDQMWHRFLCIVSQACFPWVSTKAEAAFQLILNPLQFLSEWLKKNKTN